jgi:hypothetical protein
MMNIAQMRIDGLRKAIQTNRVSFPARTPCFNQSRADIQWRIVQLYFVRGWNCVQLARRYNLTRQRIEQLLAQWVDCAATLQYLQEIPAPFEIGDAWQASPLIASGRRPLAAAVGAGFPPIGYSVDEVRARPVQTLHAAPL